MLKFTIQVKENKNKDTCNVEVISPKEKDYEKATDDEKRTCAVVQNEIFNTLSTMQNKIKK